MAVPAKFAKWLTKLVICFQMISNSQSSVHLYDNVDFKGYLGTFDLGNQSCITFPSLFNSRIRSLKTDECIMAYSGNKCADYSYRFPKGDYENLKDFKHEGMSSMADLTKSIGPCKSSVDTAGHIQFYYGKDVILELKNLCKRVDISERISSATSIDNNENCVILHQADKDVKLLAGKSLNSQNIQKLVYSGYGWYRTFKPIIGISPCSISTACNIVSLSALVTRFSVIDPKTNPDSKTSDISMAKTTTFINDGWATASKDYYNYKTITEVTEVNLVEGFSKINNWQLGTSVEFGTEFESWLSAVKSNIRTSVSSAYNSEVSSTDKNKNVIRHETLANFSVSERIEIEACTKYTVDSYVKVKERYPLQYTLTFEVTGKKGESKMTADEIKIELGQLNYNIQDKDTYTIVAGDVKGEILVDFGVETVVDGKGDIIAECKDKQVKTEPQMSYLNITYDPTLYVGSGDGSKDEDKNDG